MDSSIATDVYGSPNNVSRGLFLPLVVRLDVEVTRPKYTTCTTRSMYGCRNEVRVCVACWCDGKFLGMYSAYDQRHTSRGMRTRRSSGHYLSRVSR